MTSRPTESDPTPLASLFEEHREGLAGAVRGILGRNAEPAEILQEAFLRCWRSEGEGFRPVNPRAWIFVVTMNVARDLRRRRRRRGETAGSEEMDDMPAMKDASGPDHRLAEKETLDAARAAIQRLGDKEKEVFLLRVSGELDFESIAAALAIPVGTAKTRMRRALVELRGLLRSHSPRLHRERT